MTLFEFTTEKSAQNWHAVDDVVMGGVSRSKLDVAEGGTARFSGRLSLEQGGGFASVRYDKTAFDLGGYEGLELRVKGDAKTYQLRLHTDAPRVAYAQPFHAASDWTTLRLPFADFIPTFRGRDVPSAPPLNRSAVREVGMMLADKQAGDFELLIGFIRAY
ncbi:CIA30 family protein [soil metagenome]